MPIGKFLLVLPILIMLLLQGCQPLTPQIIKDCNTYYLYTDSAELWKASREAGANWQRFGAFHNPSDDSVHAMKWDLTTIGHEVSHGMAYKGSPVLIVEDRFDHFKRKF